MGTKWSRRAGNDGDSTVSGGSGPGADGRSSVVGGPSTGRGAGDAVSAGAAHAFATAAVERMIVIHHRREDEPDVLDRSRRKAIDQSFAQARAAFHRSLDVAAPFTALARAAALSAEEAEVLAVLVGCETDERLQQLLVHATNDAQRSRVELGTLNELFDAPHPRALCAAEASGLRRSALVSVRQAGPWNRHVVELAPSVIGALLGDPSPDPVVPYAARVIDLPARAGGVDAVVVVGPDSVRRREAALTVVGGGRLLVAPMPTSAIEWEAFVREATLLNAVAYIEIEGTLADIARRWIDRASHLRVVIASKRPVPADEMPRRRFLEIEAGDAEPTDAEWRAALGDAPRTHRLTAEQLETAATRFEANARDLDLTVRRLVSSRLDDLTRRVRPSRGWHELVLPDDQINLLGHMVHRYQHGAIVFDEWGFPTSPSRGLVLLFSGPSGTGKTLAAEVMSGALGLDLYRLDLSSVVSKFIGETEKNLDEVFTAAGAGNLVLFFDEADSLFGKRSEVKDAHDRYANLEVSYLLQRLERYDGVVILATNFEKNIDDAFIRRIHARIDFSVPSAVQRREIWVQHLPANAPLADDVDLDGLAARFELSGGSIRNAAVNAAFSAVEAGAPIGMIHLLSGVERELRKQGRLIKRDDFPELFNAR